MSATLKWRINWPLVTSSLAHILIIIFSGLHFLTTPASLKIGRPDENTVHSYLATITQQQIQHKQYTNKIMIKSNMKSIALSDKKQPEKERKASAASKGEKVQGLAALLHAAIQSKQVYPRSAMAMEREGRVTLAFILSPNGSISDLMVTKSSGTSSLDEAALQAVRDASPFKLVNKFIDHVENFSVDLVFQLSQA